MIIYLYGSDSYLRTQKLHELMAQYRGKNKETDIFEVDLEDSPEDWIKVRDFLEQPSIFVASKLAIVRETNEIPERDEKEWIQTLKKELESPKTFVIAMDNSKPRKAFSFLANPPARAWEFPELVGVALSAFIKKECAAHRITLQPDALRFFIDAVKENKEKGWVVLSTLQKLELAKFPLPLSLRDLQTVIAGIPKAGLFALARAFLNARSREESLFFLERALHEEEVAYVFNMTASLAHGPALLQFAGYDVSVKSGTLEYEEALTDFALSR